jgi:predicted AAA+ superfamily ATPase
MFPRHANIPKSNSFFLFGARGTGKSTLIRQALPVDETIYIDLLRPSEEDRLRRDPEALIRQVEALAPQTRYVVIDEVQKLPKILDVVHFLIEKHQAQRNFILTGSSARKLRHGGANLLAGRAFTRYLFPLVAGELGSAFDLDQALRWGTLPGVYLGKTEDAKTDFLQSYSHTYLKEEIQGEQIIRKVDAFHRFLEVAAQGAGQLLNLANISRDSGVDAKTIKSYFEILEDTLVGFHLEPYHSSRRKRLRRTPKFYFFDTGVVRALARQLSVLPVASTAYYGNLFEQFVINEVYRQETYRRRDYRLSFLSTQDDMEVDLVIERPGKPLLLIEIKSTQEFRPQMCKSLLSFRKDFPEAELMVWSQDSTTYDYEGIKAFPWQTGLSQI